MGVKVDLCKNGEARQVLQNLFDYRDDIAWCACNLACRVDFSVVAYQSSTGFASTEASVDEVDLIGRVLDSLGEIYDHPLNDDLPRRIADRMGVWDTDLPPLGHDPVDALFGFWQYGRVLAVLAACASGVQNGIGLMGVRPDMARSLVDAVQHRDKGWIRRNAVLLPPSCLSQAELEIAQR